MPIVPPREFGKCGQKIKPLCPFRVYGRCTLVEFEGKAMTCEYLVRANSAKVTKGE